MKHNLFNIMSWFAVDPRRLVVIIIVLTLVLTLVVGMAGVVEAGPAPGGSSCPAC